MKLLLISNSTMQGELYLNYPKTEIKNFLGLKKVHALFIPYAAVTFSYDLYESKVEERFAEIGHYITSIHHFPDPVILEEVPTPPLVPFPPFTPSPTEPEPPPPPAV